MDSQLSQVRPILHESLRQRDVSTADHGTRVGIFALAVGRIAGVAGDQLVILDVAAQLHDIGKMEIPDAILRKPGRLDAAELAIMRTHSELGERIIRADPNLQWRDAIATTVRHHHEQFDGSGYPDGLSGAAIPLLSRVLSVVDSYDAMTSARPYHLRRSHQEVLDILSSERGSKHDPEIADLVLSLNEEWFMQLITAT